jgi:hypothetical protein
VGEEAEESMSDERLDARNLKSETPNESQISKQETPSEERRHDSALFTLERRPKRWGGGRHLPMASSASFPSLRFLSLEFVSDFGFEV